MNAKIKQSQLTESKHNIQGNKLKLVPHLVPRPLWGISAAKLLNKPSEKEVTINGKVLRARPITWSRSLWEDIRADVFAAAGNKCSICGAEESSLHCHENWEYDNSKQTATLIGLLSICQACHGAIHIGRSKARGRRKEAIEHLSRVNGISVADAEQLDLTAHALWQQRNRLEWRIAVQPDLLSRYPQLAILQR